MKDWQKGIELDELLKLEKTWENFNKRCLSPFLEMKKNKIAAAIDIDQYQYGYEWAIQSRVLKVKSKINMYSAYDIPIATIEKGDRVIDRIAFNQPEDIVRELKLYDEDTFLYLNEEHYCDRFVAKQAGYRKLGIKINTFGDIQGVYFKDQPSFLGDMREFKEQNMMLPAEKLVLTKTNLPDVSNICDIIAQRLNIMNYEFTNHYSNYNKGKSWSAISLRGYSPEWSFITKPAEMSKKWKAENKDTEFKLQDTELRKMFPEVEDVLRWLPGKPHRIRFMNLSPAGGELQRHTDQVDPDAGVNDFKLMRFHFPIVTNEKVIFNQWNWQAELVEAHMKVGECWYIDVRKPHRAVNDGTDMRTHLVIDVEANHEVRALIC
tara:strand:- start:2439 stop:3569 length:1131 start_codon:yes stop_codon:yes gene_type:complete